MLPKSPIQRPAATDSTESKEGVPASCGRVRCDRSGTGSARPRRAQCSPVSPDRPGPRSAGCRGEQARPPCTGTSAATRPSIGSARLRRATARGSPTRSSCGSGVRGEAAHAFPPFPCAITSNETRPRHSARRFPRRATACGVAGSTRPRDGSRAIGWPPGDGAAQGGAAPPEESQTRRERAPSPGGVAGDAAGRSRRVVGFANPSRPAILLRRSDVADLPGPERAALAARSRDHFPARHAADPFPQRQPRWSPSAASSRDRQVFVCATSYQGPYSMTAAVPGAAGDGGQALGCPCEGVPGVAAGIEDGVVGVPELVG